MMRKIRQRRGGINRLVALLLLLIVVMLVIIAIPSWQKFRYRSERIACEQAMKSARDGLIIDYLAHYETGTVEDAMKTLDEVLPERDDICPSGGTVYLLRGSNGVFEPFCGLHDIDAFRRTRLNASHALDLLRTALRHARREADAEPQSVEISINGKVLNCVRVDSAPRLRRGTRYYNDYKGVVAFYGLAGEGDFPAVKSDEVDEAAAKDDTAKDDAEKAVDEDDGDAVKDDAAKDDADKDDDDKDDTDEDGDEKDTKPIVWFMYADEDHCAAWSADKAWSGDAYEG